MGLLEASTSDSAFDIRRLCEGTHADAVFRPVGHVDDWVGLQLKATPRTFEIHPESSQVQAKSSQIQIKPSQNQAKIKPKPKSSRNPAESQPKASQILRRASQTQAEPASPSRARPAQAKPAALQESRLKPQGKVLGGPGRSWEVVGAHRNA